MTSTTAVARVARAVASAERITVLTGAGISTASGIPDYRGPNGVWTKNRDAMRRVSIGPYLADPEVRIEAWQERLHHAAWDAEPNAGHLALVDLERAGVLHALITQNIDGLHQRAGSSPDLVLELHGTLHEAMCLACGRRTPMREQLDRVRGGDPDPSCAGCGGVQRSATVAFGQQLDERVLDAAFRAASGCDLFLAVGTSLVVQPAAALPEVAVEAGADLVIVTASETPLDDLATAILHDPIADVLPAIVASRRRR
ncbi:MAG TPA: Sir2 family NAD-dependent protein deacetylase [Actinomycetota bacterium]|nr:Sir2 family NAD-dependent protein deacetylase [Actinomycetota bacterium]